MVGIGSWIYPTAPARSRSGRSTGAWNYLAGSYLNAVHFQGAISGDVDLEHAQGTGYTARET